MHLTVDDRDMTSGNIGELPCVRSAVEGPALAVLDEEANLVSSLTSWRICWKIARRLKKLILNFFLFAGYAGDLGSLNQHEVGSKSESQLNLINDAHPVMDNLQDTYFKK